MGTTSGSLAASIPLEPAIKWMSGCLWLSGFACHYDLSRGHVSKDGTNLDLCLQNEMSISRVGETKNASELVDSEVAYITNLELWGLEDVMGSETAEPTKGTWDPISSSTTSMRSAMIGGLFPLLRAVSSIWMAS